MTDVVLRKKLLPLVWQSAGMWGQMAQLPFKPRGLLIWDAPPRTLVSQVIIGIGLEVVSTIGPVPARWFMSGESYEQIAKKIDDGAEPPAWVDWSPMGVGQQLRVMLEFDGRPLADSEAQLVIWGEESVPTPRLGRRMTAFLDDDVDGELA